MDIKPNFCLNHIKDLSLNDARRYIDSYFIPLTTGDHAFYTDGKYEIYKHAVIKSTYFDRMSSEIVKYYFKEKTDLRTIRYDIHQPVLFDTYINFCPKIKQSYKPYVEFDDVIKAKVNIMLNHISEVLCSDNKPAYEFVIKWFANMIKGNRNNSCLYLRGQVHGSGKSTPLEFMREHVMGLPLCYQGGSAPLKTKFNKELSGKLMVMFEELESFGASEWMSIRSVLKRQITSPTLMIESKGVDAREEKNLNNYVILSNNDAIQDDDGRRYFILDISTKYVKNEEYFERLYTCFNDEVGHAFYSYLYEIDTEKFNPQSYPKTQSKLDSYSKRLDNIYKYLKDEYILKKRNIDRISVSDFYQDYVLYCSGKGITKPKTKIDFNIALKNINIEYYKSNGTNYYKISLEQLTEISNKFNWVHDLDEFKQESSLDKDVFVDYEQLYKKQTDEINDLKEQIKKLTESQQTIISISKTSKPKKMKKGDEKFIVEF